MGRKIDLTGQRFERLLVLNHTNKRSSEGSIMWLCQCDCGKQVEVASGSLRTGNTRSCGCLSREQASKTGEMMQRRFKETEYIDGTSLCKLTIKAKSSSPSGRRGVYFYKPSGKWVAAIRFKKHRYHLGYFDKFEDAVKAREQAEEKLFEPILNDNGRSLYEKEN